MATDPTLIAWLLDSDPALRWQVERDLCRSPGWEATRERVATEGFGARLLALQDADGQWAGGAYFPGDFDFEGPEAADGAGQPYTATTWALNTLREWGVAASALPGTVEKLDANCRWEFDDLPYWGGEVDCCINGFTLANGAWLGADVSTLPGWFRDHQMQDGGWNCMWEEGSVRSSFISTLNSLKGILYYEKATGDTSLVEARHAAEEYLLVRRGLFRLSTGEPVADWIRTFAYPTRWFYNALTLLDYFREASLHDGIAPDPRLAEAVELLRSERQPDGTWLQARRHPGRVWFEVDVPAGEPSPWVTFLATRALEWWDSSTTA